MDKNKQLVQQLQNEVNAANGAEKDQKNARLIQLTAETRNFEAKAHQALLDFDPKLKAENEILKTAEKARDDAKAGSDRGRSISAALALQDETLKYAGMKGEAERKCRAST